MNRRVLPRIQRKAILDAARARTLSYEGREGKRGKGVHKGRLK
ncbi:MAG: hypothetical protein QOI77_2315 [Blastocatellia bacterium]|jgi:hypothetical protein|nr:hypothetical protein [Blastocatellia bacterium]